MSKVQYPKWLTGIHQVKNKQPSKHPTNANRIRGVAGSRPKKKKFTDQGRKPICINFAKQLDKAMDERAMELRQLSSDEAISQSMEIVIEDFFKLLIATTEKTTNHTGRTPPRTWSDAKALRPALQNFQEALDNLITNSDVNQLYLADALHELCVDVQHYTKSIEQTYFSYEFRGSAVAMRNRPPKNKARTAFMKLVAAHRAGQESTSYPKDKFTLQQLEKSGHKVSERTLRLWKQQLKNGTFWYYIQPKSGNK